MRRRASNWIGDPGRETRWGGAGANAGESRGPAGNEARSMPGEGFEPPTFGLQNRCTTTVLTRHISDLAVSSVEHVQLLFRFPFVWARCNRPMAPLANASFART